MNEIYLYAFYNVNVPSISELCNTFQALLKSIKHNRILFCKKQIPGIINNNLKLCQIEAVLMI